jgi:hypothetical protein
MQVTGAKDKHTLGAGLGANLLETQIPLTSMKLLDTLGLGEDAEYVSAWSWARRAIGGETGNRFSQPAADQPYGDE